MTKTNLQLLEAHPLAKIIPRMSKEDYTTLVKDIGKFGCRNPIDLYEGKILDGINRKKACVELGSDCPTREITFPSDAEALAYVISQNVPRRHLTTGQRAVIAAKLATMKKGDNQHSLKKLSSEAAAKDTKVSITSLKHAKFVQEKGAPETIAALEDGSIKLAKAVAIAHEFKSKQSEMVEKAKATKPTTTNHMAQRRKTRTATQEKAKITEILNEPGPVKFLKKMQGAHSSTDEYLSAFKKATLAKHPALPESFSKKVTQITGILHRLHMELGNLLRKWEQAR